MTVARSSGCAIAAASSRSTGSCASSVVPRQHVVGARPSSSMSDDVAASVGSSSRTLRIRSRKSTSSTIAATAPQWPSEVLHLLGRGRVVDRDRRRAEQDGGDVGDVELGAVAHHEHDPLAPARPQLAERARDPARPVGVVGPGQLTASRRRPSTAVPRGRASPGPSSRNRVATVCPATDAVISSLVSIRLPPALRRSLRAGYPVARPFAPHPDRPAGPGKRGVLHRPCGQPVENPVAGVENLWKMVNDVPVRVPRRPLGHPAVTPARPAGDRRRSGGLLYADPPRDVVAPASAARRRSRPAVRSRPRAIVEHRRRCRHPAAGPA